MAARRGTGWAAFVLLVLAVAAGAPPPDDELELASLMVHLPNGIDVQAPAAIASFSAQLPDVGVGIERRIAFARTGTGCGMVSETRGRNAGAIVIAARGNCPFYKKAAHLVGAGAAAVVIANSRNELLRMDAPSDGLVVSRPVVLVANETGAFVRALARRHGSLTATLRALPAPRADGGSLALHWALWASAPLLCAASVRAARSRRGALAASRDALLDAITRRLNTKRWVRRLELVGRVALCATFVDDALRALTAPRRQLRLLARALGVGDAAVALGGCVLAGSTALQLVGSALLLARRREQLACRLLIGWACAQPALYRAAANGQLLATSASVVGGLLLAMAEDSRLARATPLPRAQLCGRVCATGVLLHGAYGPLLARVRSGHSPDDSLLQTAADVLVAVGASLLCLLVICGFKSRWSAAALVVCLFVANAWLHPFWALDAAVHADLVDGARFCYFHTLSAVGALLLLVLYGPGRASIDEPSGPLPVLDVKARE